MTPDLLVGTIIGASAAFLFSSVFAGARFWALWEENQRLEELCDWHEDTIKHLEQQVNPREWLDASDAAANIAGKKRLYDKYEDLIKPGTEVIRIYEGDMPGDADGW